MLLFIPRWDWSTKQAKWRARRSALKAELGDVLWYMAQVATELDLTLDEIAEYNIAKLMDRLERGKIKGDGDNR